MGFFFPLNSSTILGLVDTDSSIAYYRLSDGLVSPAPPEEIQAKVARQKRQAARKKNRFTNFRIAAKERVEHTRSGENSKAKKSQTDNDKVVSEDKCEEKDQKDVLSSQNISNCYQEQTEKHKRIKTDDCNIDTSTNKHGLSKSEAMDTKDSISKELNERNNSMDLT